MLVAQLRDTLRRFFGGGSDISVTNPIPVIDPLLTSYQGAFYYGVVTGVPGANQFTIDGLKSLGAGKFAGATAPYQAFVFRDAGGASAAPQGEQQPVTGYVTASGQFTTTPFTAPVAVGDEVLIIHPDIAAAIVIIAAFGVPAIDSVANLLMRDITGNKADTPVTVVDNVSSQMRYIKGIVQTAVAIFNLVNSLLVDNETGGTITTDGTEQDVYINNAPAGLFEPRRVKIDLTDMTAAETIVIRTRYRINPAAGLILQDEQTFAGVQARPLINIDLEENRYGIRVSLECTAGGPIDVDWARVVRE